MFRLESSNPYQGIQDFVAQLPELAQPLIVALAAAIPYVEGEGAAALGIIVGINPVVAAAAAVTGNLLCVVAVVLLSSRIRGSVVQRRKERVLVAASDEVQSGAITALDARQPVGRREKGRERLRRWLVRFGVPGASLLAPLALPTQLTAALFVASGVRKGWVILWQAVAIILWTGLVAAGALGLVSFLGW